MKVGIDAELCNACELCANTAPAVFEMGDETARVIAPNPLPPELEAEAQDAADVCPDGAIIIE